MRRILSGLIVLLSLSPAFGSATSDSFADVTASGGTSYSAGSLLLHQINGFGAQWFALTNTPAPPATGLPVITNGNLSYPGFPAATGNSLLIPSATGVMGRLTLGFAVTNDTVYCSFLLKVLDLSQINTSGTQNNYFAAFGDTVGNQNATLLRAATRIYTRRLGSGFALGVSRNSNNTADWIFDTTPRNTNEVLLVVASYSYNNHTANLWINPPASSFGAASAPAPVATATGGADLNANGIRALVLGCRTNPPPGCIVDELRVATSWAVATGAPEITTQPENHTGTGASPALFSAVVAGGAPLSFQWRKDGADLADGARISGAHTATLTISNVVPADVGSYTLAVSNAYGTALSQPAALAVNDPSITREPAGQVVAAGASATFSVAASGTAPLVYQWYKESVPLANDARIGGANTATLTLNNASWGDVGSYSVRITNGVGGSIASSNATLFVSAASTPPKRPNIIFILADDLGYGDLGVLYQNGRGPGLPREKSPNLDAFAAEGLQLRQHYCPAPVCAPSRASLLLGVHQGHANVRDDQFEKELAPNHTLATVLKTAGYATACIGKWGLKGNGTGPADWTSYPTRRGFDYYFGYVRHGDGHEHYPKEAINSNGPKECYDQSNNITPILDKCYTTDLFTARAKKWIADQRAANPEQPFFLYLAFDTPHAAYELPTQAYPTGGGLSGGMQWLNIPGQMISTASGAVDSFIYPDYASATYDDDNNPLTPEIAWPEIFKRFASGVRRIDDAVGDIKKLLQDLAIDTNTLVVFTSDNGPTIEDYLHLTPRYVGNFFDNYGPFDGVKRDTWEGGIRMPTLVRWPGQVAAGTTNQSPSQFHDWMATFAELAGLPSPARSDGVSLVPTLLGSGPQSPSTIYVEYYYDGTTPEYPEFEPAHQGRVMRQMQVIGLGGYQGVRYNITSHSNDFEIYDVTQDPRETTNLAADPGMASLQQRMKDRVLQLRRPNPTAPRPYDAEFVPPIAATAVTNGQIDYAVYEGIWPWMPQTATLNPAASGKIPGLALSARTRDTNYVISFSGYIRIKVDGDYTFYLNSDCGTEFRIHDATVIDDDFTHANAEVSGTIRLRAGLHPFRLMYRHNAGTSLLDFEYSGPGLGKQPVPASALYSACSGCGIAPMAEDELASTTAATPVTIDVLANDTAAAPLTISAVTQPSAGAVQIVGGEIQYTPASGFLGEDRFVYTVSDGTLQDSATVRVQVCYVDGVYWFPFNESAGLIANDASGYRTARLYGFTNDPAQWVPGKWNQALSFDGFGNYAELPNYFGIGGTAARTCAAWVKTTSAASMALFSWGSDTPGNEWTVLLQSGQLRVENSGGWLQGTSSVNDGQWHHVACAFQSDGSPNITDTKLYVDGSIESSLSSQSSQALNTVAATPVMLGSDSQGRFFAGVLDEARIYDRALSAGEIASLALGGNQSAAAWYRRYFGWSPTNWNIDDDGDGLNRLAEYAFGGQPLLSDATVALISAAQVGSNLEITFHRRISGTHELTYELESSRDLKTWSPLAGTEVSAVASFLDGFEEVTFLAQSTGSLPLFARLKAVLP